MIRRTVPSVMRTVQPSCVRMKRVRYDDREYFISLVSMRNAILCFVKLCVIKNKTCIRILEPDRLKKSGRVNTWKLSLLLLESSSWWFNWPVRIYHSLWRCGLDQPIQYHFRIVQQMLLNIFKRKWEHKQESQHISQVKASIHGRSRTSQFPDRSEGSR